MSNQKIKVRNLSPFAVPVYTDAGPDAATVIPARSTVWVDGTEIQRPTEKEIQERGLKLRVMDHYPAKSDKPAKKSTANK